MTQQQMMLQMIQLQTIQLLQVMERQSMFGHSQTKFLT